MLRHTLLVASAILASLIVVVSVGPFDLRLIPLDCAQAIINIFGIHGLSPHRLVHFLAFGLLSFLTSVVRTRLDQSLAMLGLVVTLGVVVETLEMNGTSNPFEFWDVRDDTLAAIAGHVLGRSILSVGRLRFA